MFEQLKALRKRLAVEKGVPAYVIFHDSTLKELSRERPTTGASLAKVKGIGPRKLQDYGVQFLREIEAYVTSVNGG